MSPTHTDSPHKGGNHARSRTGESNVGPATAPYNFIPYDPRGIVPSPPNDGTAYTGVIHCRLRTLTPLLVAGPQEAKAQGRRFFMVGGKPVIPGTSLKGMLRSFVEIISHSHLSPVNGGKLFWRNVTGTKSAAYKEKFPPDDKILGGFLHRKGAHYTLEPASRITRGIGPEAYQTGPIRRKEQGYIFHRVKEEKDRKTWDVPPEVMETFFDQMTEDQENRWGRKEKPHLDDGKGARVFYCVDKSGQIAALGTARYFRVAYRHTVRDLVGECPADDFAAGLFGSVGRIIRKGRVAVSAARFTKHSWYPAFEAILMEPHPTCLLHYLQQPKARDCGNKLDELETYDSPGARLRGRKYYWHCKSIRPCPEHLRGKSKIVSRLYPLAAESEARFTIRVDGVSGVELGALLTALELPQGHAHKLGLGKALGLGSVRLEIEDVLVQPRREHYASLRDRFAGGPAPLTLDARQELKAAFQDYIGERLGKPYGQLESIRTLLAMTDFDHCPRAEKTAPMPLEEKYGQPNFAKSKALLPSALKVYGSR